MESQIQRTINKYSSSIPRYLSAAYEPFQKQRMRDEDGLERGFTRNANDVSVTLDRFHHGLPLKHPKTMYGLQKPSQTLQKCATEIKNDNEAKVEDKPKTVSFQKNIHFKDNDFLWKTVNIDKRGVNLTKFLFQLFKNQLLCDFVIKVGQRQIGIHSLLLVEHSDKYYTLLCSKQKSISNATVNGSAAKFLELVLEYLYTGEIQLSSESVNFISSCAKQLDVKALVNKCEEFKRRESNREHCKSNFLSRISSIFPNKTSDFLELDIDSFSQILASDNLRLEKETDIFSMAVEWLNHKSNRPKYDAKVLGCVRYGLISPKELTQIVETKNNLIKFPILRDYLYEAYKFHALNLSNCAVTADKPRPKNYCDEYEYKIIESVERKCGSPETLLVGKGLGVYKTLVPFGNKQPREDDTESVICGLSVKNDILEINQDIYVFGGTDLVCRDPDFPGRQILRLSKNAMNKKWEPISVLLPVPRSNHCAVVVGSLVYIIGGAIPILEYNEYIEPTNMMVAFDTRSCEWIPCSCMSQPRVYFAAAFCNCSIFVFGGQGKANCVLRTVESYEPDYDSWTNCRSLPIGRVGSSAAEYRGIIYIVGGYAWMNGVPTALKEVYSYDPFNDCYCRLSSLSKGLCYASLLPAAGRLWLIGGAESRHNNQLTSVSNIRFYNLPKDEWVECLNLRVARHNFSSAAMGDKIFVIGGLTFGNKPLASVECFDIKTRSLVIDVPDLIWATAGTCTCAVEDNTQKFNSY